MRPAGRFSGLRSAACLAALLPGLVFASDAREWLSRMEQAVEGLNYEGTFVHMSAGTMETLHVIHRVADGVPTERLFSRDQPGREVIRSGDEVTCIFADEKAVLVERREVAASSPLRAVLPQLSPRLDQWYEFRVMGRTRQLGRPAMVVEIRPRDSDRYGHRLWLDEDTAMPLKVHLVSESGHPVEALHFVDIELPDEIPAERMQPGVSTEGFTWYRTREDVHQHAPEIQPSWQARDLPPGFELSVAHQQVLPGSDHAVEHLVYSDGLASVSVFVEPAGQGDAGMVGPAHIGAAHAYSALVHGHQVTVVGEVPALTVRRIALSMTPVGRDG
ncbi:MAG: MucB/RseB C-terminal domain-containing protein [Gammaproteobacteria bacterium]